MAGVLVPLSIAGQRVGTELRNTWPNSTQFINALRPLVHRGKQDYLVEDYDVAAYYLPSIRPGQWHDPISGTWYDPASHTTLTGTAAIKAEILARHFQLIALDYAESPIADAAIRGTITEAGYKWYAKVTTQSGSGKGSYTIWVLP